MPYPENGDDKNTFSFVFNYTRSETKQWAKWRRYVYIYKMFQVTYRVIFIGRGNTKRGNRSVLWM